jgi:hypothetical protein
VAAVSEHVDLQTWARQQIATRTFRLVAEALEADGIRVVPVKGIVTARLLYGDVAERPMSDVDLRIVPRDFGRAMRIAAARGWHPSTHAPRLGEAQLKVDGWYLEIEATLGPPGLCALSVGTVMDRARRCVEPFGFPHLEPELHDHALILVLNAFKDGLLHSPWSLEDLRRVVRHERFRPDVLVGRAREGRVQSAVWIVADWMAEEQRAVEWRAVRDRIGPRPPSERVARVYGWTRDRGWPSRLGVAVSAASNDALWRSAAGAGLIALGVARARALRVMERRSGKPSPDAPLGSPR